MTHTIATPFLWPAEKFANLIIERDSHVKKLFANFYGKSVEVETFSPKLHLTIKFYEHGIRLIGSGEELVDPAADVKISGDSDKLLRVLINRKKHGLFNQGIKVTGDAELAQKLYDTLMKLDIDWSDVLTPWLGHVLANGLDKSRRRLSAWGGQLNDSFSRNLQDYLKEENKFLSASGHFESLKDDIDLLKLRVDRVMARTQILSDRINRRGGKR